MKTLSKQEMMGVNAGANYELTCPNGCGYKVGAYYLGWSIISKWSAQVVVGGKMHKHIVDCTAKLNGL